MSFCRNLAGAALAALAAVTVCAGAQTPAAAPPTASAEGIDAKTILDRTFAAYAGAKTYQADWTYTMERGAAKQQFVMEIRNKAPNKLVMRVVPAPGGKAVSGPDAIPEMQVVLDGQTAWFENGSEHTYFRVPLPKQVKVGPLAFFPQIRAVRGAIRVGDQVVDGKSCYLLEAKALEGDTTRVSIDQRTMHVLRLASDGQVGGTKIASTLALAKETVDAELTDAVFTFHAGRDSREVPAPPGAGALFGVPDKPSEKPAGK